MLIRDEITNNQTNGKKSILLLFPAKPTVSLGDVTLTLLMLSHNSSRPARPSSMLTNGQAVMM